MLTSGFHVFRPSSKTVDGGCNNKPTQQSIMPHRAKSHSRRSPYNTTAAHLHTTPEGKQTLQVIRCEADALRSLADAMAAAPDDLHVLGAGPDAIQIVPSEHPGLVAKLRARADAMGKKDDRNEIRRMTRTRGFRW